MQRRCAKCNSDLLVTSKRRGLREELLFVLGSDLRRCSACDARHAYLGNLTFSLPKAAVDNPNLHLVMFAIVFGIIVCIAIAIWTLKRFHRWPPF
jgi:predicted membrane-bound spermidine synthase